MAIADYINFVASYADGYGLGTDVSVNYTPTSDVNCIVIAATIASTVATITYDCEAVTALGDLGTPFSGGVISGFYSTSIVEGAKAVKLLSAGCSGLVVVGLSNIDTSSTVPYHDLSFTNANNPSCFINVASNILAEEIALGFATFVPIDARARLEVVAGTRISACAFGPSCTMQGPLGAYSTSTGDFSFVWAGDYADAGGGWAAFSLVMRNITSTAWAQAVAGAQTNAGALTRLTKLAHAFTGALAFAGAAIRKTRKAFAGAQTNTGALSILRRFARLVAGALTFSGAISTLKTWAQAVAGAITFIGTYGPTHIHKIVAGAQTFVGVLVRKTRKAFSGALTFVGGLVNKAGKALAGAITFSGGLIRLLGKHFSGALTFIGHVIRGWKLPRIIKAIFEVHKTPDGDIKVEKR